MQSAIPTRAYSPINFIKRWLWHRELCVFLIHYGIWIAVSLVSGWLLLLYLPADALSKTSPMLAKFQNDWPSYVKYSFVADFAYVLPVHAIFWLYQYLFGKGKTWAIVLFVVLFIVYFLFISGLTGFLSGYMDLPLNPQEAVTTIVFMWVYSVVFIGARSYRQNRRRQRELEMQKTQAELQALKTQVNPHFMFNTLNNLYGTALSGDAYRTAAGIEQLSSVMRHITDASQREVIPVEQELRFVEDIVELHRMRLPNTDTIQIETVIDWDEKPAQIAPLLLNPLIENAFKYGISMQNPCFVRIRLEVHNRVLHLEIENSVPARTNLEKGTGLGLANVRKRLNLAYLNQHSLRVKETDTLFSVDLMINL